MANPSHTLSLFINGVDPVDVAIERLVIAGWAGRDEGDVEHHIQELEALGVARPSTVPYFYELAPELLTISAHISVVGTHSSAEVEVVLIQSANHGALVGIGSDHTDRRVESYDVTVSKQMCAKPVSRSVWRYVDVEPHWDALIARSWLINANGARTLYQEGTLDRLLHPARLIEKQFKAGAMPVGASMFCGTQAVIGPLQGAGAYEFELHDPVLDRSLHHRYSVTGLDYEV